MISSVDSSSSLSQMFFQNRFPKPKEDPLLAAGESVEGEEGQSATPAETSQPDGVQNGFAQLLQRGLKAESDDTLKEQLKRDPRNDDKRAFSPHAETEAPEAGNAYDALAIKARYNFLLG